MKIFVRYKQSILTCLMMLCINSGFAQMVVNGTTQRMTLNEAIEIALKNSLDIQISKNTLDITTINNHLGVAGGLPTVTGNATTNEQLTGLNQELSNGTTTNRTGVAANNLTMGVTATMLLYNGGRVIATKQRLQELQKLSKEQLNTTIQNVIADVSLKYYAVVQQQNFLTTLQQSINVSQQKLNLIENRKNVGLSNEADFLQARLDLNAQTQSLQSQKIVIEQSKADLIRALSIKQNSDIVIADSIVVDRSLEWEAIEVSLKNNPNILSSEVQINVNKLLEREAAARKYPSIAVNGGYNYGRNQSAAGFTLLNQSYGPFLGLTLSVPIYTGTVNNRQIQITKINTQNAQLQRDIVLQNLQVNAAKAWEVYINTQKLIEAEQQNYALSGNLLTLVNQRFQLGQATIIDVKQAQQSFENSGYRLNNLSYTTKIAEITLKQLAYKLGN
jgi:outer membrane protein